MAFTQRDKRLWRKYLYKLADLSVTDITPYPEEIPPPPRGWAFQYLGRYGETEVAVEYYPWTRRTPGYALVRYLAAAGGHTIMQLTAAVKLVSGNILATTVKVHIDLLPRNR